MASRRRKGKKYFTRELANATLPLVQSIVRDIAVLANDLRDRQERLAGALGSKQRLTPAHQEELKEAQADFERAQEKMSEYEDELKKLGVELKDYFIGLIDFPCWMDKREVCLCWKLGEPEVGFWHETNAGFAGRQRLPEYRSSKPQTSQLF